MEGLYRRLLKVSPTCPKPYKILAFTNDTKDYVLFPVQQ